MSNGNRGISAIDREMDEHDGSPDASIFILVVVLAFFALEVLVFIVAALSGSPDIVLVFAWAYFASVSIWFVVRTVNRRHDPRRTRQRLEPGE